MFDKKDVFDFLYQSISDAQQTIRALDIKAGFVFLILLAPLPFAQEIYHHALTDCHRSSFGLVVVICAVTTWLLAIIMQFITISAIIDPQKKIQSPTGVEGSFFAGGLYSFNFVEAICGSNVLSKNSLDEQIALLPKDHDQIIRELTFERMKLSFILALKSKRSRFSNMFTLIWLISSAILCIVDRVT